MHNSKYSRKILPFFFFILCCTGYTTIPLSNSVNKRVAVVFLKHSPPFCPTEASCLPSFSQEILDSIHSPRHTATEYENMLNSRISSYFNEVTYNKVSLTFEAILNPDSADGWFDAPHQLYEYNNPDPEPNPNTASYYQDALSLVYPLIGSAIENYDILLVVQNIQSHFGFTSVYGGVQPGDFVTIPITAGQLHLNIASVTVGENPDDEGFYEVVAHEFGHVFSLYHSIMGRYDQMGGSDVQTHFSGWSKMFAGWLTGITDMPCIQGPCEITTELTRLEYEGNNLLRIPFIETPYVGYIVECRAKVGFDENIPEAGVVISYVDTTSGYENAARMVFPTTTSNSLADASLIPGDVFLDEDKEITIVYESKTGSNNCIIKATRGEITAPDPMIRRNNTTEETSRNPYYFSEDIYIDSQKNGWGIFGAGNVYSGEGEFGAPTGRGDPFWVNHENRIMFRIRNEGFGPAENLKVNIFVRQPLTIYIPGITCQSKEKNDELIGSVEIDHLDEDEIYYGYVPWTPNENSAALVTVAIDDYVGEISHGNNMAKETYPSQLSAVDILKMANADGTIISSTNPDIISVEREINCITGIPFYFYPIEVKAIARKDWVMQLSQTQGFAQPGEETEIEIVSIPPSDAQPGDCGEAGVVLSALMDDIYLPVETIAFRSCMVEVSKITCESNAEPIEAGAKATITGDLSHQVTNETIALEYTSPSGAVSIENTQLE